MGIKIPSPANASNSANSIINTTDRIGESSWVETVDLSELKAGIATLWTNMSHRINHNVPYGMTGLIVGMLAVPLTLAAVYFSYRAITAASHYFRKPVTPLGEKPIVKKALVEKAQLEKALLERSLAKKTPVEKVQLEKAPVETSPTPIANQVANILVSSSEPGELTSPDTINVLMADFTQNLRSIIGDLETAYTLSNSKKYTGSKLHKSALGKFKKTQLLPIVEKLITIEATIKKLDPNTQTVKALLPVITTSRRTLKEINSSKMIIMHNGIEAVLRDLKNIFDPNNSPVGPSTAEE